MGRRSTRQEIALSDADRAQPAEFPEACLAGPHRPGIGFGLRAARDHAADGHVEADGLALPVTPGHAGTRTHDLPARGPRRRHRQGRRPDGRPASLAGVPRLPRPCRRGDRTRKPGACHPRHRLVAQVRTWPKGRPDRTFRFTPTPASRTDAVEGFFPRLSGQRPKDAVFDSLDECITAIEGCIAHHNVHHARPFRWSRKPEDLVEACKGGHRRLREMAPDA